MARPFLPKGKCKVLNLQYFPEAQETHYVPLSRFDNVIQLMQQALKDLPALH